MIKPIVRRKVWFWPAGLQQRGAEGTGTTGCWAPRRQGRRAST
jgi:hypothetical protein